MNSFLKYKTIKEGFDYTGGEYGARVVKTKEGKHVAKFFKAGEHMTDADYTGKDETDAHEFAKEEMEHRKKSVTERINEPQGHTEVPDHIADGALEKRGRVKKMMGNRMPIEIIARILARTSKGE